MKQARRGALLFTNVRPPLGVAGRCQVSKQLTSTCFQGCSKTFRSGNKGRLYTSGARITKAANDVDVIFSGAGRVVGYLCKEGLLERAIATFKNNPDSGGAAILIKTITNEKLPLETESKGHNERLRQAVDIFDWLRLSNSTTTTIDVYRALLTACRRFGAHDAAFALLDCMDEDRILPDEVCFGVLTAASCDGGGTREDALRLLEKWRARQLDRAALVSERAPSIFAVQLIKAFTLRHSDFSSAFAVLDVLEETTGQIPSMKVYGAMAFALQSQGQHTEVLKIWERMSKKKLLPDGMMLGCLCLACSVTDNAQEAQGLVNLVRQHRLPLTPLDAAQLMKALCSTEYPMLTEALSLFDFTKSRGIPLTTRAYASLLKACADLSSLEDGIRIHHDFLHAAAVRDRNNEGNDWHVNTAIINMYAKCSSLADAQTAFDAAWKTQQEKKQDDNGIWNAMLLAFSLTGLGTEALAFFGRMQQAMVKPDDTTFINLLNACSHGCLADDSLALLSAMEPKYGIPPTLAHVTCVVDALGRVGRLEEAERKAEGVGQPDVVLWTSLLGACRLHKDVERAERIFPKALALEPKNTSLHVLMANIYAAAGRKKDLAHVRQNIKEHHLHKIPGRSWLSIQGEVHAFVAGDTSHPQIARIHAYSRELHEKMKEMGYTPDLDVVLHDETDEWKEKHLCTHSERLAIVCGLLNLPPSQPIRVLKNLRVCPDCHAATKSIAAVSQRTIILRDASRFHHFTPDGKCSCNDKY